MRGGHALAEVAQDVIVSGKQTLARAVLRGMIRQQGRRAMRWIGLLLLLAVLLGTAACGKGARTSYQNATSTSARVATATTPAATAGFYQLPTGEPIGGGHAAIKKEDAQRLRSLAPTGDEFGAAFPDLAPFERELRGDLGQEYEHIDLAKHGFLAGYVAFYRPADVSHSAYISFAMFDDASGASGSMRDLIATEFGRSSTFEVGEGDESYGLTVPASQDEPALTIVLLRQDRVVAFLVAPNGEDQREGMRQLARDVAGKIRDALAQ
jgi:hypothetical protein